MNEVWNKAVSYFTDMGVSRGVAITYIIVSALLVVMALVALVMRIIVIINYKDANKRKTSSGKNSCEIAREVLDRAGMKDVKIKKAGFFRWLFIGNSYSISQKTIFLRKNIFEKDSVTAATLALQKVGVAKLHKDGKKSVGIRNVAQILSLIGPILFVPVVLAGFIVDFVFFGVFGMFSVIGIVVGLVFVLSGFVATMLNIPVEKKANGIAMKLIKETGVLNEEEQAAAKKVLDSYIVAYVCEFIVAILRVIQIVLEVVMNVQINNSNSN